MTANQTTEESTNQATEEAKEQAAPYTDNLDYLQAELHWIETRCQRIITQRKIDQQTGEVEAPSWERYGDDEPLSALEARQKRLERLETHRREHLDERLELTRACDDGQLAIEELVELYSLDDFERTILLLATAVAFSRRFEEMYGDLQNSFSALTVEAIFNFCELPFAERITRRRVFAKSGRLVRNDLVSMDLTSRFNAPEDLLTAQVQVSNRTFGYLVGDNELMDEFMEFSSVEEPRSKFDNVVLADSDKQRIMSVIERHDEYLKYRKDWGFDDVIQYGKGVLMLFYGKPGTGKTMMAHAVADEMQKRVLNVDIPTFLDHRDADRFLPALFREARMQDAILFFDECEALFGDRRMGNPLMTMLLTKIERFEGVVLLATNRPGELDPALDRRLTYMLEFPFPKGELRAKIWRSLLPEEVPVEGAIDFEKLGERYRLSGGLIKNAVFKAAFRAARADRTVTMELLEVAAREETAGEDERAIGFAN